MNISIFFNLAVWVLVEWEVVKRESNFTWEFISDVKNSSQRRPMIDTPILSHTALFGVAFDAKIVGHG